ncbi:ABC transporter permease [Macrococcus carouselicus]|uniref:Uncharacterized protein n=1 Tax=Macrococcus carouselicus TaxID=69969 RepID=A0A9Q8CIT3_9STAP|nr:ABC transporter permease [Macrococcus carouselicus]TDM03595.1 hypothetical protein ERX40_00040 [Macrococcus carouselicus]
MLSKTLSLNKGLFQHFFFNNLIFMVINIVATFFLIPFAYIILKYNGQEYMPTSHLLGVDPAVMSIFFTGALFYSILSALGMTYFWKNEEASDFMHSLPFTRSRILAHMVGAFLTAVSVNLLINGTLISIFSMYFKNITPEKIGTWIILTLIISLFTFIFTLFVGQLINHYFGHLLLTGLLLLLPLMFHDLATGLYRNLFRGAAVSDYGMNEEKIYTVAERLTFPLAMINNIMDGINWLYFGYIMVATCLLLAATYYLYQRRRNERIVHSFRNRWLEWAVITLVVLLGVMVAGAAFTAGLKNIWVIGIIYLLAFIIIYLLAQAMNQRSPRVKLDMKALMLTFTVVAMIMMATYLYGKWQEGYVPDVDDIEAVSMQTADMYDGAPKMTSRVRDPKFISEVVKMHQEIVDNDQKGSAGAFKVYYKLKNGLEQQRFYNDLDEEQLEKAAALLTSAQFGKAIADGYNWDELKKRNIYIQLVDSERILEPRENEAFIDAFRKDTKYAIIDDPTVRLSANSAVYIDLQRADGIYEGFNLSPYQKNIIAYMIDKNMINRPSDIFQAEQFYRLDVAPDYFRGQLVFEQSDFDKISTTKISGKAFNHALDAGHADYNGRYIYAVGTEDIFAIIKMNKEVK